jgi:hypothetical protein
MSTVDRRHFLMSSVALPAALKASALQSPNNTVRVAVVGFNGRGKAHISAYLKMPNVEIAALCDVGSAQPAEPRSGAGRRQSTRSGFAAWG